MRWKANRKGNGCETCAELKALSGPQIWPDRGRVLRAIKTLDRHIARVHEGPATMRNLIPDEDPAFGFGWTVKTEYAIRWDDGEIEGPFSTAEEAQEEITEIGPYGPTGSNGKATIASRTVATRSSSWVPAVRSDTGGGGAAP